MLLLEQVKFLSHLEATTDLKGILVQKDGCRDMSVRADIVGNLNDLYNRIRAVFTSICYIMCAISNGSWFGYEDLNLFLDYLYDIIFRPRQEGRPPVAFFNRAYICTMNEFCTAIRNHDVSMKSMTEAARSSWSHYWTAYTPQSGDKKEFGDKIDLNMLPPDLVAKVQNTWALARELQSKSDKSGRRVHLDDSSESDVPPRKKKPSKAQRQNKKKRGGDKAWSTADKAKAQGGAWKKWSDKKGRK